MRRAFLIVFGIVLFPASALAQANGGGDYVEKNDAQTQQQNVVFKDDPLAALPLSGAGATLLVRPSGARMGLLRPRTQFISEMLKSVESL